MKMLIFTTAILFVFTSCVGTPKSTDSSVVAHSKASIVEKRLIDSISPKHRSKINMGDDIIITYKANDELDSAILYVNGIRFGGDKWIVKTSASMPGDVVLRIDAFKANDKSSLTSNLTVVPPEPKIYDAKVIKSYPHSTGAYTQGLEFYNGFLYESSGEYGKSFIQRLKFPSMQVDKNTPLEPKYFAEGLTIMNNKIYQLSWKENTCFVRNPEDLSVIKTMPYSTEGWGIANDGKNLYMSDGSHFIYILSPDDFKIQNKIQVVSDQGIIHSVNELEWINGEIWANVYGYDLILRINPKNGVVTGVVNVSGILPEKDIDRETDVLNGIAYDKSSGKVYITGKNWPKLFEVELVEKK